VLLSHDSNPEKFLYLIKTTSLFEFGTKHHQLVHRVMKRNPDWKRIHIYYSGELQCDSHGQLVFNFFSGTFDMKHQIKEKTMSNDVTYFTNLLREKVEVEGSRHLEQTILFKKCPLITSELFPLKRDDLDRYKSFGAIIYEFQGEYMANQYKTYFGKISPSESFTIPVKVVEQLEKYAVLY
jgi:hypothetical protein